jgi:glutathione S-transferase
MQVYWIKAQAPLRVLALLKHLGIEAECIELDLMGGALRKPDYAQLNPSMKVPTLVDGDLVLTESAAIMAHLCIAKRSDMWPANHPAEQVEMLRWLSWSDSHWSPSVAPFYFEHIVKSTFGIGPPDRALLAERTPELERWASVLDGHLASRRFIACQRLTIADFVAASMARYWRESEMPMEKHRNVVRWLDGLMRIPAWAEPWPKSTRQARASA